MAARLPAPLDVRLMNWTATVLFLGCAALALFLGVYWVMARPVFAVQRIVVQGDLAHNNAASLRMHAVPSLQGNFFTVDLQAVRAAFEQVPWVRRAQVQREFPGRLRVVLREHEAVAYWGQDAESTLLNAQGEVFEATPGEVEQNQLPRLTGPREQSAKVLQMYHALGAAFAPLGLGVDQLELVERGSWRATLDNDAVLELGMGAQEEVLERVARLVRTIGQVTAAYKRRPDALQAADLRHASGYAVRIKGVTTLAQTTAGGIGNKPIQNMPAQRGQ